MAELVTIATYNVSVDVYIAKGLLENAGIPAFLPDEPTTESDSPSTVRNLYGTRLQVRAEDVREAMEILSAPPVSEEELTRAALAAEPAEETAPTSKPAPQDQFEIEAGSTAPKDKWGELNRVSNAFALVIKAVPSGRKIEVIKAIREIRPDLDLRDAKDLVDNAPQILLPNVEQRNAENYKQQLEAAGAQVELTPAELPRASSPRPTAAPEETRCPRCGSSNVVHDRPSIPVLSLFMSKKWKCRSCGREWK